VARKAADKKVKITQVKSAIGTPLDQKRTVRALGLKRIGDSVEQVDSPVMRGMVFKVKHLVKVEEL
jgi:large subunit ribosomal protein L30